LNIKVLNLFSEDSLQGIGVYPWEDICEMGSKPKLGVNIGISKIPLLRDLKVEIKSHLDNFVKWGI